MTGLHAVAWLNPIDLVLNDVQEKSHDQTAVIGLPAHEVDEALTAAAVEELLDSVQPVARLEVMESARRGINQDADNVPTAVSHLADDFGDGRGFGFGTG